MKTLLFLFLITTSIANSQTIEKNYNSNKVSFRDISDSSKDYVKNYNHSINISINDWIGSVTINNDELMLKYIVNGQYDAFENDSIKALILKECTIQHDNRESKFNISLVFNKQKNNMNLLIELSNGDSYYYFSLKKIIHEN